MNGVQSFKKPAGIPVLILAVMTAIIFAGCSKNDITGDGSNSTAGSITIQGASTVTTAAEGNTDDAYDADDLVENSSFTSTVSIAFGITTTISNPLSADGVTVTQSGDDITITSTAKAVAYVVSGTTANGSVKIYSDNKFQLTLNGLKILWIGNP